MSRIKKKKERKIREYDNMQKSLLQKPHEIPRIGRRNLYNSSKLNQNPESRFLFQRGRIELILIL